VTIWRGGKGSAQRGRGGCGWIFRKNRGPASEKGGESLNCQGEGSDPGQRPNRRLPVWEKDEENALGVNKAKGPSKGVRVHEGCLEGGTKKNTGISGKKGLVARRRARGLGKKKVRGDEKKGKTFSPLRNDPVSLASLGTVQKRQEKNPLNQKGKKKGTRPPG